MEDQMDAQKKCGGDQPFSQNSLTLSTPGVTILPSMDAVNSAGPVDADACMPDDQRPGFKICAYVDRFITVDDRLVPIIKPVLDKTDYFSSFYVRCGILRHDYTVSPGLYGIGNPDKDSEVLVTANFKLTFDHLRKNLSGIDAWILVLDTRGINVWCAAGKGTFSTRELVNKIKDSCLEKTVAHRQVIVPQLGATGVSAKKVQRQSGFRVIFGPVRAKDIPAFLENNNQKDSRMKQVTFDLYDRSILTPVELQMALKPALIAMLVLFFFSGLGPGIFSFSSAWQRGLVSIVALLTGIFSGALVTPVLLPFIPFRQFALKGMMTGSVLAVVLMVSVSSAVPGMAGFLAIFLFSVTVSSYLAMNFTGATPFTSPSGVEREMKRFIPVQACGLLVSTGCWIYSAF